MDLNNNQSKKMKRISATDTLNLSIPERIQLVEDIWDTIAAETDSIELNEEENKKILEFINLVVPVGEPLEFVLGERLRETRVSGLDEDKLAAAVLVTDHQFLLFELLNDVLDRHAAPANVFPHIIHS